MVPMHACSRVFVGCEVHPSDCLVFGPHYYHLFWSQLFFWSLMLANGRPTNQATDQTSNSWCIELASKMCSCSTPERTAHKRKTFVLSACCDWAGRFTFQFHLVLLVPLPFSKWDLFMIDVSFARKISGARRRVLPRTGWLPPCSKRINN